MAEIGDMNTNGQKLIRKTTKPGNHYNQRTWILRCNGYGREYGANGCDFHERKCPYCQRGVKGLPID